MELCIPNKIFLDLSRACNAHCNMCAAQMRKSTSWGVMSDAIFEEFVNQVTPYSRSIVTMTIGFHGEPLLDTNLPRRIKRLSDLGMKSIEVNTNGSLLDAEAARALIESGVARIIVDIDGLTPATYESIRCGLHYHVVLENLTRLIEIRNEYSKVGYSGPSIFPRFILQSRNIHEVDAWQAYWNQRITSGLDNIQVIPIHNWAQEKDEFGSNRACPFIDVAVCISSNGDVLLCCLDYDNQFRLGNIMEKSYVEIMNSSAILAIREIHRSGKRNTLPLCGYCSWPEKSSLMREHVNLEYLIGQERFFANSRRKKGSRS